MTQYESIVAGNDIAMGITAETAWYEEWFNSDFYLDLYSHRNDAEAEACIDAILRATWLDTGDERGGLHALDVACGPGRHAITLAKRGFDVTAVDLSPALLRYAAHEAEDEGVNVRFMQMDMRSLRFANEFSLAVQLFSSFGYFESADEDMATLRGVRGALLDGGYYAIDLINEAHLRRTLVPRNRRKLSSGEEVLEEREFVDDTVVKEITIGEGNTMRVYHESVRLYAPDRIEEMLRAAGMQPIHWFGDYTGMAYDREHSPRMIVVSRAG